MDMEFIKGLVYNVSLLLSLSIIYNLLFLKYKKEDKRNQVIIGVIIGFIGVLLIQVPVKLSPGLFFDTRSILVSVSAMFFGGIPTIIACAIIITCRIIIGGSGALMGVLVTLLTSGIGLIWNRTRFEHVITNKNKLYLEFYFVGLIAHIGMILCEFALPSDIYLTVIKKTFVPILLVYPIGSFLLSIVLFNQFINNQTRLDLKKSEEKFKNLYFEYQNRQTLLKALINSIPDLIFYKNLNSEYFGCNSAFEKFTGRKENDIIGHTDLDLFDKEMADLFQEMDRVMLGQEKPRINEEIVTYPDGSKVLLETLKTPYFNSEGTILGLIGISRDITERKKREEEILYLTYHDVLTGLYNRTFFEEARKRLDSQHQLPFSVIVGDINGLKLINDAFGHVAGDKVLAKIAKILKMCCQPEDIVARIGGDEFCILLPKTDNQKAHFIIDEIKKKCEEQIHEEGHDSYYASISLGHATKRNAQEPFEKIFRVAEEFMYRLKLFDSKSIHSSIISSIKTTLFEKSNETEAHAERLAKLSKKLGMALGLGDKEITELELLSTLHDIGKINLNDSILSKPDKLTESEWYEVKKHPVVGYRIAQSSPELKSISEYILCHHERWDGKGYPQGLSEDHTPLLSRILTVVDSYDAMTQDRVYRKAMTKESAIAEIKNNAGTQFDPNIAQVFIEKVLNAD